MKLIVLLLATGLLPSFARTASHSRSSTKAATGAKSRASARRNSRCEFCERDAKGRILRISAAKRSFRKTHPCPSTGSTAGPCVGYVVDHVHALKHGGKDKRDNMQWQTTAAARAKDRVED